MFKHKFLAFGLLGVAAAGAQADMISLDFESYPDGKITNGYDGWKITNSAWDQEVVSSNAISGNKSWRMSNAVASGSFGDQPFTPALNNAVSSSSAYNVFKMNLDFEPLAGGKAGENVVISIDNGTGQRGNYIRIRNSGGIDNSWQVDVFDYDGTNFINTVLASNLSAGTTYNLGFTHTFVPGAQNDVWTVDFNGATVFTGIGWEDYFVDVNETVTPYDRLLFRAGGAPTSGAVGVLFDNITYQAVPEPGTMVALGAGALALIRRRKKA